MVEAGLICWLSGKLTVPDPPLPIRDIPAAVYINLKIEDNRLIPLVVSDPEEQVEAVGEVEVVSNEIIVIYKKALKAWHKIVHLTTLILLQKYRASGKVSE